jgi:hypothetical protein
MRQSTPRTRYARSGDARIAYQVIGNGPFDLIFVPGFVSNVEHLWEVPGVPAILERFASYSRLITWDKRGTGLSDPVLRVPPLEERIDDMLAVLDAVGSEQAADFWRPSTARRVRSPVQVRFETACKGLASRYGQACIRGSAR